MLLRQVSRAIREVANAKTATNATILRSTFEGVTGTFNRVGEQKRELKLDATATKDLKTVLFGPAISIEAVRLIRADAILSAARASPSVAEEIKEELSALIESEMSSAVRDRLRSAARP